MPPCFFDNFVPLSSIRIKGLKQPTRYSGSCIHGTQAMMGMDMHHHVSKLVAIPKIHILNDRPKVDIIMYSCYNIGFLHGNFVTRIATAVTWNGSFILHLTSQFGYCC